MHACPCDNEPSAGSPGAPLRAFAAGVIRTLLLFLIHAYQALLRPFFVGTCKFCPTCSEYAVEALRLHGPWQGSLLAGRRLCRCHPFAPGGIDPVPEPNSECAAPDRPGAHVQEAVSLQPAAISRKVAVGCPDAERGG